MYYRVPQKTSFVSYCRWEELPNGPLIEIARRLSNFEDFMVLHLVCTRWNSVLRASACNFLDVASCAPQVPWLMMVEHQQGVQIDESSSERKAPRLLFYSLSFQRVHGLVITLPPELLLDNLNRCCLNSSHGWLLFVRKGMGSCTPSLYNPFRSSTHNYIPLPGFDTVGGPRCFALSASPCTNSYSVLIVGYDNKPAFWRPGDDGWTILYPHSLSDLLDVTFYRGDYYVLNYQGVLFRMCTLVDTKHTGEKFSVDTVASLFTKRAYRFLWKAYFVVVEEKLLVVNRVGLYPKHLPLIGLNHDYLTAGFEVVEIVISPKQKKMLVKEVESLGNKSLFVGLNQAFAVEVPQDAHCEASRYYGCKPNCIYFTDDRACMFFTTMCCRNTDMGVYNMADGSIERDFQGLSLDRFTPSLWVEPRC